MKSLSEAPSHLSKSAREWFDSVMNRFVLEPHHGRLLTLAAEAWDRCQQARAIIAKDGPCILDRFKIPRAHPMCAVERDSRIGFARLLRELNLDLNPPQAGPGGPPNH